MRSADDDVQVVEVGRLSGPGEIVDLRRLGYFVAVAGELNFSRAAVTVGISQQALSSQIRCLEREIGRTLFFRTTRRVELTPAGRALLPKARASLASAAEALESARAAEPDRRYNPWL
ncbi:MAG TPA: LysR family transcriptional regulator [Solirubrobacterales bacterium]|jgi:DNA-binding transcriptional LysR family regulator